MPRDSPRRDTPGDSSRFRDGRRDRLSRKDDRGPRRDPERDYGGDRGHPSDSRRDGEDRVGGAGRDGDRDGDGGYRNGNRHRDEGRGYGRRDAGRGRDDDRRRDRERARDRDDSRPGPSRRSASPRVRSSRPDSRSGSRAPSEAAEDKAKPNFGNSGLLAAATKTVQHGDGTKTVLKYHEPPEARKPTVGWRLYVFKGKEQVGMFYLITFVPILRLYVSVWTDLLHIQRQSAYLVGRDKSVVDIPIDHPSCSKQHAAIQCV